MATLGFFFQVFQEIQLNRQLKQQNLNFHPQ